MKKLCPNCGKAIDPDAKYCPYCHFNLMNNDETIVTVDKRILRKSNRSSFNIKRWLVPIVLVVAFLAIFALIGTHYYSRDQQLARIETELKSGQTKNLTTDGKLALTANNVKPLSQYYQKHPAAYAELKKNLSGKNNGAIKLVQQGRHFFIFPRYVLKLPVYNLIVNNAYQHATVSVNGQKYSKKMQVLPGQYQIKAQSTYLGQKAEQTQTVAVFRNTTSSIHLNAKSFKVKSTPYGNVYINNKLVDKLDKNGTITFRDVPMSMPFSIYVAKKHQGKLIKTKTISNVPATIKDKKLSTLNLTWQGSTSLKELLEKAFNDPQASAFVKGSKNSNYKDLKQLKRSWEKSPNLKSYKAKITIQEKSLNNLRYLVKYTFTSKTGKRKQVMRYSRGVVQKTEDEMKIKTIGSGSVISSK